MHSFEPSQQWEYCSAAFDLRSSYEAAPASVIARMNELGADGWELVSSIGSDPRGILLCIFKRRRGW